MEAVTLDLHWFNLFLHLHLQILPSVPQPPGAAAQCVAGDQGLHTEGLQQRNCLPLPDQVPLGAGQQGEHTKQHEALKTHYFCGHLPLLHLDSSVRVFPQVDRANFAGGDCEDAELLLCGGREDRRSVLPGRMSGLCNSVHHLPLHGDSIWEGKNWNKEMPLCWFNWDFLLLG